MSNLLIIDDNPDNLLSISALLKTLIPDCNVLTAETGPKGIEIAKNSKVDTILLDIQMPIMDGVEVCRILKSDKETKRIPIIMLTAVATDSKSYAKGLELGADAFFSKPIDKLELSAQVKAMLRIKNSEDLLQSEKALLEHTVIERSKELLEREERYRNLFEQSLDSVLIIDAETEKILDYNENAYKNLGYSKEEFKKINVSDIKYIKTPEEINKQRIKLLKDKYNEFDTLLITKDDRTRNIHVRSKIFSIHGKELIQTIFTDTTKRVQAEETQLRLLTAFEQTEETVMIIGTDNIIQYVNTALLNLSGYSPEDIIGKKLDSFERNSDQSQLYLDTIKTLNRGETWAGKIKTKKKDGGTYDQELTISPVRNSSNKITGFVSIGRDIGKELDLEEQLRQSQKMEAIGTLAGGIAHDFNNILGGILGFTEISMDDTPKDSPVQNYLREILQSTKRAADLVSQILTFSRKTPQETRPIKIIPIITESIKLLQASLPATIEIQHNIDISSDMIDANTTQIHQVIMNLCTNAAQAIQKDSGLINISLTQTKLNENDLITHANLNPGPYLKLTIHDNGSGIEPSNIDRIFDPFFTTKDIGKGTGMGLSVTHGIIQNHGGFIKVESLPGKGTTFDIFLPQIKFKTIKENDSTAQIITGIGNILFVDDEEQLTTISKRMISALGYTVTVTNSAFEALEIFKKNPGMFDLIITDQTMPKMTGYRLAENITKIRSDLPVILCSGYIDTVSKKDAEKAGIKALVVKPITKAKISQTIHDVLNPQKG